MAPRFVLVDVVPPSPALPLSGTRLASEGDVIAISLALDPQDC